MGESGQESIRHLNDNALFTYAVKAIQELHEVVKATAATDRGAQTTVSWIILFANNLISIID